MNWKTIDTFDFSRMQFVLVHSKLHKVTRLHLWNPSAQKWERAYPIGSYVQPDEDCYKPTHWMPLPEPP